MKDHQGNNRVVVSSSGTVMETNHYYPFGGVFSTSTNLQPYKYNGKELDTKNGLKWYDYGARHYDAALGRWHVVDPLAEKYYSTSPFSYCLGNPIVLVDEEGKAPVKALKALFNVGRKAYKTYKKTGKADIIQAIKQEGLDFADNVKTLFDSESSTFEKVIAGVDLVTGFGDEAAKGAKMLGIADEAAETGKKIKTAGRGSNHLAPAEDAVGEHSTFRRGDDGKISNYATYKTNSMNPTGYDEVKRVDIVGGSHKNKQGDEVPTPHVHEKINNVKIVRTAKEDELPRKR